MKNLTLIATAIASVALTSTAFAAQNYKLDADATYMISKTEVTTTNTVTGHAALDTKSGLWSQEYRASAIGSSGSSKIADQTVASTERYLASGKLASDITTSGMTQFFAKIQAEKDLQSSLDYNAAVTVGLSHTFLTDSIQTLKGEVGVGNRFAKERGGHSFNEVIGTLGAHYDRKLTPQLGFFQDLGLEAGQRLTTFRSRTGLTYALSNNISALASYELKNENPQDMSSSNTQLTTFGLKYKY